MMRLLELITYGMMLMAKPAHIPAPAIVPYLVIHVNAIGCLLIVAAQGSRSRLMVRRRGCDVLLVRHRQLTH